MACYGGAPQDTSLIDFDDIFGNEWTSLWCFCAALWPDIIATSTLSSVSTEIIL